MQHLLDISGADASDKYREFLLFDESDITICVQNYEKTETCIYATFYVYNIRNILPSLLVFFMLLCLSNAPAIFPREAYFISIGIFFLSELIFILVFKSCYDSPKMTIDKLKQLYRPIDYIRHFLFLLCLLIGVYYLSQYPDNLMIIAAISYILFYILYYYMSIGIFRKVMKKYSSRA